ncbi:unnamed protein product [Ilex paraguariensis]|uniref:Uncharacterized protein n=1 Tax=Ilex paraguariensis TaxID=185542 RepID=A0ABC8RUG6_9AQUA
MSSIIVGLQCMGFCFAEGLGSIQKYKGSLLNASHYHVVNLATSTAVGAEVTHNFVTSENTITIGTQHSLDPLTTVKARVNNFGQANALIQHEFFADLGLVCYVN